MDVAGVVATLTLRFPMMADAPVVKSWRTDLDAVSMEEHAMWFSAYVPGSYGYTDKHRMFIGMADGSAVGYVRLDGKEISYLIAPQYRRRGYGVQMVRLALERWNMKSDDVVARIKYNNYASIHCAAKVGIPAELLK